MRKHFGLLSHHKEEVYCIKYEFQFYKYKQTSGIEKRRDNAHIVKHVYGGIIKIIMEE